MDQFLQVVVSGVLTGSLYGLLSSGLSLSFGITRVVNFAHGDIVTVGMFLAVASASALGVWFIPLALLGAIVVGGIGVLVFVSVLQRTAQYASSENEAHLSQIAVTVGLSSVLQGALLLAFGPSSRSMGSRFGATWHIGSVYMPSAQVVAFVVSVVIFGVLHWAVNGTDFGRALRAVVDDRDAAAMSGVNANRMFALTFGIGVALACVAGILLATYIPSSPLTGTQYLAIAFVTVVLGGLGSVTGAFLGGIVVGVIQQASANYIAIDMQNIVLWIAFVVILMARPSGIFGLRRTA